MGVDFYDFIDFALILVCDFHDFYDLGLIWAMIFIVSLMWD
jgi:hypothetical protein